MLKESLPEQHESGQTKFSERTEAMGMKRATRSRRYRTILADPPWQFGDRGTRLSPDYAGHGRKHAHYGVMDLNQICRMGDVVSQLALDDAFLLLWAPGAFVIDGAVRHVACSWGFDPKQLLEWVKTSADGSPRIGGGHYTRLCTECLVLCVRGTPARYVKNHSTPNVFFAPRQAHSAKPDVSYEIIESLLPGPYLELFARRRFSPKWDVWGDEAPHSIAISS